MRNKLLALSVASALFLTIVFPVSAATHPGSEKENRFTEKVKAGIIKLGVGPDARIKVKLRDKSQLAGYVSDANQTTFVITSANGTRTVVPYAGVAQVKGNNLSTGAKIAIAAAVVGVLAIIYFGALRGKHL
jgi:hypothetical protein